MNKVCINPLNLKYVVINWFVGMGKNEQNQANQKLLFHFGGESEER